MSERSDEMQPSEYDEIPDESEQLDQIQPYDSLEDRGVDDVLDEGLTTPERWSVMERTQEHDTIDERISEEEPDPTQTVQDETGDEYEDFIDDGEVGGRRSGRLVDPNEGIGQDVDGELYGTDVGIDGAAASAEEAAVHVIEDEEI
jgi:hypothetical protein